MPVFVVISHHENTKLEEAIHANFENDYFKLNSTSWVVASADASVEEVSRRLGILEKGAASAVVFQIAAYYGRYGVNLWTWIKAKWEASSSGE
jgi:hypothetical protein